MPSLSAPRNAAALAALDTTLMSPDMGATASPWLRANPHAAPNNSKTSQYIDKITSENERLRRELLAEKLAREDEAKRVSAAKTVAEDSRAEYQHLQITADANQRAIERKDRKIEELKAALEAEAQRRQAAENRAEEALRMLGDTRSETQREIAASKEVMQREQANAEATKTGYQRKFQGLEKQAKTVAQGVKEVKAQRREDADTIKRLQIVIDQQQHETARALRTEAAMKSLMENYKQEKEKQVNELLQEVQGLRLTAEERQKEADALKEVLLETHNKMKWVIAQSERQAGRDGS
jgi:chromosome segregation ATPase